MGGDAQKANESTGAELDLTDHTSKDDIGKRRRTHTTGTRESGDNSVRTGRRRTMKAEVRMVRNQAFVSCTDALAPACASALGACDWVGFPCAAKQGRAASECWNPPGKMSQAQIPPNIPPSNSKT